MVSVIKEGDKVRGKDDEETEVVRVIEVIYGRHGVKKSGKFASDNEVPLVDSSPGSIYDKVKSRTPKTYDPSRIYIAHTDRIRTLQTALSIAQAKRNDGRRPKDLESLMSSDNTRMTVKQDDRINIIDGSYSKKAWEKRGATNYISYMFQNPESVQIDGDLIEPHVSVESRLRDSLRDGIEKGLSGQYDCIILTTHQYNSETQRGIANGRGKTAKTTDDIGGEFDMEEFDRIVIGELKDGTYKCFVEYKGHVVERKLKDIVGYEVKGDKERAKALGRILQEERMYEERANAQLRELAPAQFGRN